ncbi:hypothetical protein OOK29_09770 [Streptomyces phaeochromogenes]|uniref:hypothetical protein n=1 Tax=Streptomyces phaeochromogenes TaxID=1923 RepID=UPI002252F483|nr:hypothetical protein [Streptomyces phaeochromogenes]MCX5598425.1 hypothetical protein [Streptomyces phaeochromogenes]
MSIRPPIGTRYRITWSGGTSSGVTVVPTGKSVPATEVNVMRDGDGGTVTVNVDRLGNPETVTVVAATLRTAAEWFSGDDRDTMREVADQTERAWDDICPVCEEVDCDDDCPLEDLRAAVARGELRRES